MNIKDIKPYVKKLSLSVKVLEKTPIRKVTSKLDNVEHNVCEALLGDETGTVYLTLWDATIDKIEVGKSYDFTNLYSSEFKKSLRLNIGRFGEFKETSKEISVNLENQFSKPVE